jgi:hypothetical protein
VKVEPDAKEKPPSMPNSIMLIAEVLRHKLTKLMAIAAAFRPSLKTVLNVEPA